MKKRIYSVLLLVVIVAFMFSATACSTNTLIKKGKGKNYQFTAVSDFTGRSNYSYSESQSSIWDFYSVEYDVEVPAIKYQYYLNVPNSYRVTDVSTVKAKGTMAHSQGIYYIRESAFGFTVEVIIDTVYETAAYKISGLLAEFMYNLSEKESNVEFNTWVCYDYVNGGMDEIKSALKTVQHFYDEDILDLFNDHPEYFEEKSKKYELTSSEEALTELHDWFLIDNIRFKWEVTEGSATIDLSKKESPKVTFSLTALYTDVNESITCGGTLKYNNINNTVLDIPEEVQTEWQSYSGYDRTF